MIQINNIKKKFKNKETLSSITLSIEPNKIYGLLGRNGAGKSTLMNLISNRRFVSSGSILINDQIISKNTDVSNLVFLMSEVNYYNENMSVIEHFKLTNQLIDNFNYEYAVTYAKKFELNLNSKIKHLSTGYITIFKMCIALSINVPYLLLDEPTVGLDPNHRKLLYKLLIEYYQKNQNTIVISTHIIDEITNIIEEVIIIDKGSIISQSEVEKLLNEAYVVTGSNDIIDNFLKNMKPIHTIKNSFSTSAYVLANLENIEMSNLDIKKISLQDLFIAITSKGDDSDE